MADKTIQMIEKENPPRKKEEFSTLTITVSISGEPKTDRTSKSASLKMPMPLVKEIEGPFDENDNLVEELKIDKTYIYKATKFKKSNFTPIKHIWWAEQLDDGKITDLEYKKNENPCLDKKGIVCFKYTVKECEKVRIYAYVAKPEKAISVESKVIKSGKAILVAFPEQNPKIPKNQGLARWFEKQFDDGDGKVEGAGHAGIVIIDKDGKTKYFDFGRYKKNSLGTRPEDTGTVRSSKFYYIKGKNNLSIPNWKTNLTEEENVRVILKSIHDKKIFKNYGITMEALAEDLDYNKMLEYAISLENKGYHPFGGYTSSTDINNATYCAKFARGVAEAGGFDWSWYVFTGKQNVEDVEDNDNNKIIIIK